MEKVKGEPVYLLVAVGKENILRPKPDNLVSGRPITRFDAVT